MIFVAAIAYRTEGQLRRFKVDIKQAKVSKMSISYAQAKRFQKGRTIFRTTENII
jgi:hypothetical protein